MLLMPIKSLFLTSPKYECLLKYWYTHKHLKSIHNIQIYEKQYGFCVSYEGRLLGKLLGNERHPKKLNIISSH